MRSMTASNGGSSPELPKAMPSRSEQASLTLVGSVLHSLGNDPTDTGFGPGHSSLSLRLLSNILSLPTPSNTLNG